jgi:hypothetical protein
VGEHKRPKRKLFLALPIYGGQRYNTIALLHAFGATPCFDEIFPAENASSLLAYGFNMLWLHALKLRKEQGVTHFLMLHADIVPLDAEWLAQLHSEMERAGAQVLSAVAPIKDGRGLTSTALDGRPPRRLSMQDVLTLPVTFTHPDLLVNTGMLLVDLRPAWVEQIYFSITDRITKGADGSYAPECEPEDWHFSRLARRLGVQLWATRRVRLIHAGHAGFSNYEVWGTERQDPKAPRGPLPEVLSADGAGRLVDGEQNSQALSLSIQTAAGDGTCKAVR